MSSQLPLDQAVALLRQGRPADAEPLLRAAAAADPADFASRRLLAVTLYQQQKFADALTAVEGAIALKPDLAEPYTLRGVILHNLGRSEEAIASMDKGAELAPGERTSWYNRGVVLSELGRFEAAIESFDRALAITPMPDGWVNRAGALINLQRPAEALESCDRALVLAPHYPPALSNRGLALSELKRNEEALAMFDHALSHAPGMADTWNNRGTTLHDMRLFDDAVASFDRALALQPQSMASWSNRGRSFCSMQRFEEGRASFEKALAVGMPRNAADWNVAGDALVGLKRYEDALSAFDKVLAINPRAVAVWGKRATTLYTLGRFEEGLESTGKALALNPDFSEALDMRGRILLEMNRIEEGLTALRQSGEHRGAPPPASEAKARHDAEQAAYLAERGITVAPGKLYIYGGDRIPGPVVNPANAEIVAKTWAETTPQIVVIDDLLTPEGLAAVREFCWGSTMWQRPYENGYLGAMPEVGFAAPLLAQIAEELRATFPTVIGDHGLRLLWGFKYDSRLTGINMHADQAAVNVNFWITPDEANLNPDRGGIVIYNANAPADWEAADYNGNDPRVRDFLARVDAKPVVVPYRANRAVIFDSDLFHETDVLAFKEGYLNRRINLTMLFGRRTFYGG